MGIPGLMTYAENHPHYFYITHELKDTYVIIDGDSLCNHLYRKTESCGASASNYDIFYITVKQFFEELLMCNVTPLVLMDGGIEDKKLKLIIKRFNERITSLKTVSCNIYSKLAMPCVLMKNVFIDTLKELNISFGQTTFEADESIAAIATVLNCPILSIDSDFFIFGASYIPLDKLIPGVVEQPQRNGYVKLCRIYRVENLIKSFPGLDISTLPLFAALLGNDYLNNDIFRNFFIKIIKSQIVDRSLGYKQAQIHATLQWLQNKTLDSAIQKVLNTLPRCEHYNVVKSIELVVNSYYEMSPTILSSLGFPEKEVDVITKRIKRQPYQYEGYVSMDGVRDHSESTKFNKSIVEVLPTWFLKEYHAGHFCEGFINMLTGQLIKMPVQIENFDFPPSSDIALPIIGVIHKLLTTGIVEPYRKLEYIDRDVQRNEDGCATIQLEIPDKILGKDFPSLHNLRELPMSTRRKMIDEVMGICPEMKIEELDKSLQLYVGIIIYWLKKDVIPHRDTSHAYALLFSMLFGIVDSNIGFYRSEERFVKMYGGKLKEIKKHNCKGTLPLNVDLKKAIHEVTKENCLIAAEFLISKFRVDESSRTYSTKFDITVVHVFGMFQCCLLMFLHLNALLGYPYEQFVTSKLFNGTLLYNLYMDFKGRSNIDAYIENVLENAPSLLRVFKICLRKVQQMCDKADISIFGKKQNRVLFYPGGNVVNK